MKRMISAVLVLVLVVSLAAVSVSAACNHSKCSFVDNGNGTHASVCKTCGKTVVANVPCDNMNGACPSCGHDFGTECTHPISSYVFSSANNGTHASICGECGKMMFNNIPCDFNDEGKCFTCGYGKVVSAPTAPVAPAKPATLLGKLLGKLFR